MGRRPNQKINILRYKIFCIIIIEYIKRSTIQVFKLYRESKFDARCKLPSEMVPLNSNRFLEAHKVFFALSYIYQCFEKISNRKCHQNVSNYLFIVIVENSPVTRPYSTIQKSRQLPTST